MATPRPWAALGSTIRTVSITALAWVSYLSGGTVVLLTGTCTCGPVRCMLTKQQLPSRNRGSFKQSWQQPKVSFSC